MTIFKLDGIWLYTRSAILPFIMQIDDIDDIKTINPNMMYVLYGACEHEATKTQKRTGNRIVNKIEYICNFFLMRFS